MKSVKILFVGILSTIGILISQKSFSQGFAFGPKVGFNYTSLPSSASEVSNNAGKAGFQAGVFLRLGGKTYLQPELLFGSNSAQFSFSALNNSTSSTLTSKFTTMEIPVLLGHKFISLPLLNFRGMIGPDFVFLLKKPGLQVPNPGDYSYKDSNVGAVVGLGVDVASFTIDARYNFGLSQINSGFGQRLNFFNLSIGFKII